MQELGLENDLDASLMAQIKKLENEPKYLDSVEEEVEKMMKNAKIELSELGFDLDKPKMDAIIAGNEEEEKEVEVDDTELQRLLDGGLPFCRKHKDCGHRCLGVKDEEECLPCLHEDCQASATAANLPSAEDLCNICYTCEL